MGGAGLQGYQREGTGGPLQRHAVGRAYPVHVVEAGDPERGWPRAEDETTYLDIKKAHLAPKGGQDIDVKLPRKAEVNEAKCVQLVLWLYGCHFAAQAWEEHYSALQREWLG